MASSSRLFVEAIRAVNLLIPDGPHSEEMRRALREAAATHVDSVCNKENEWRHSEICRRNSCYCEKPSEHLNCRAHILENVFGEMRMR